MIMAVCELTSCVPTQTDWHFICQIYYDCWAVSILVLGVYLKFQGARAASERSQPLRFAATNRRTTFSDLITLCLSVMYAFVPLGTEADAGVFVLTIIWRIIEVVIVLLYSATYLRTGTMKKLDTKIEKTLSRTSSFASRTGSFRRTDLDMTSSDSTLGFIDPTMLSIDIPDPAPPREQRVEDKPTPFPLPPRTHRALTPSNEASQTRAPRDVNDELQEICVPALQSMSVAFFEHINFARHSLGLLLVELTLDDFGSVRQVRIRRPRDVRGLPEIQPKNTNKLLSFGRRMAYAVHALPRM